MKRIGVNKLAQVLIGLVVAVAVLVYGPWGVLPAFAQAQPAMVKEPTKIPYIVQERIRQLESASVTTLGVTGPSDGLVQTTPEGELDLEFHAAGPVGTAEKAELLALGATILFSTGDLVWPPGVQPPVGLGMITARVPYDKVAAAAALPWVVAVTPAEASPPDAGSFLSEGVALHGADVAQAAGINGAGVTVGVISDGATNRADAQALGDLPAVLTIPAGCVGTGGNEGTGMLEIIHDMAPGAALQFCSTGGSLGTHVNALLNLAAAGADIIAEDIPFDSQPAFQKGLAATTADVLAVSGVSIHSSAGNLGNRHAARVAAVGTNGGPDGALGPFAGCPYNPQNVVAIAPNGDTTFDVSFPSAGTLNVTLQWSEPRAIFPTAGAGGFTDLDLFVMNTGLTQCLGTSTGAQGNGSGDTIEQVSVAVGAGQTVKIVVNVHSTDGAVATPLIDLRWRGGSAVDTPTRAGSLNPDSNYTDGATSAAAADASVSTNPTTVPIEGFSAGGPVQLITTTECTNGMYPCAGNSTAGGPGRTVGAPTWTTADGVSISGVGGFGSGNCPAATQGDCRFFGTSAAAPHAAGVAALVRQAMGTPTPAELNTRLAETATDRGTPGFDNVWGFGVLNAALAAIPQSADLQVTKFCKPDGAVKVGQTATCTMQVQNLGPDPALNVKIVDHLVSSGSFNITTSMLSVSGGAVPGSCTVPPNPLSGSSMVTCTSPSMPKASTVTVTLSVTATTAQDINDDVTVTSDTTDPNPGNNHATGAVHFVSLTADLQVSKTCKPDGPVPAGTTATCTIDVDNLGPDSAAGVTLVDAILSNGTFQIGTVSTTAGSCTETANPQNGSGNVTCNLGTVAASAQVRVTVSVSASDAQDINDRATVSSSTTDPNTDNNNATGHITFAAQADLSISKEASAPVIAGLNVTYTIDVKNNGPSVAPNVVVTDTLPVQLSNVSFTPSAGSCNGGIPGNPAQPLTCTLGSLANGASAKVIVVGKINANTPNGTYLNNNASVSSGAADPNNGNNSASAVIQVVAQADLFIVKTSDKNTYKPSSLVIYTVKVTNNGPSDAQDVVVTDTLPDLKQAIYQSDTGGCTMSATNPTQLTCNVGSLPVDQSRSFQVNLVVKGSRGDVSNTAIVTSSTTDLTPGDNTSTRTVRIGK
jgi:uncharacterized repeat protein (TIGR01451 family)